MGCLLMLVIGVIATLIGNRIYYARRGRNRPQACAHPNIGVNAEGKYVCETCGVVTGE